MIALIGIDWGSTNARAFAFDERGEVIGCHLSSLGAMTLASEGAFAQALDALAGDWMAAAPDAPLLASGMVGARGGWVDAGYVAMGSTIDELRRCAVSVSLRGGRALLIVPGVKCDAPDVMRGEETQLIGANLTDGVAVMPGTHSKWVRIASGRMTRFETYLTGEMNALLRAHSTVGKALATPPLIDDHDAILRGVHAARAGRDWLHRLFSFRARVVTGAASEAELSSELSAWLIASEIIHALEAGFVETEVSLIAEGALGDWYARVAEAMGYRAVRLDGQRCAARGLWMLGQAWC